MDDTRHSGFTLAELLVALGIVALLAGLAVPAMGLFVERKRLHGAAETLIQELRLARNHAITHQQTIAFRLASTTSRIWCFGWSDKPFCNCMIDSFLPGACGTGGATSVQTHQRRYSEFPNVQLHTGTRLAIQPVQFSAVRGTARANTFRLGNSAGEIRVIVSPLGRIRACATRSSTYPPC